MASATSVHSNAFNFMSFLQSGVDVRTGQYTIAIDLPEIKTNDLRGPEVPLGLHYNPLNTVDSGYGLGWNLQLSQYTPGNQILSLGTGETFKVTDTTPVGQLLMRDKKLDTFHFYRVDATHFRVMHKSGRVEILELVGGQNQIALPSEVYAPSGHKVSLAYRSFGDGHMILQSIKDASGNTLLSLAREPGASEIEVLMYPFAGPDGTPLARFVMTLQGTANQVSRITLPTDNQAAWRFEYGLFQGVQCLTGVDTPVGGHEQLFYQDQGHAFPANSGRTPLPRVTRSLVTPGFGQPPVDVRYTYPQNHNFLGFGLDLAWAEDGYDNLFKHIGGYEYHCDETWWVDESAVRSIARTFNQFHLLVSEVTTQNDNRKTVAHTYSYEPGKPYDQQPNDCQLPKEVTTSWLQVSLPTRYRSEVVTSLYDEHGNLTSQTQASGVVEESVWYAAAGEDGCPPDPEGFVRNLKEKIVTPAPAAQGDAPTLSTRFRYRALAALPDSGLDDWLVPERETLVQLTTPELELQNETFEYHIDLADPFQHGRIASGTVVRNARPTVTEFVYSKLDSEELQESVEQTVLTLTGFDGADKVVTLQSSLFNGQPLLDRDDNDVEIRYEYDSLRRVTRETVAPGTLYEASRRYEYELCAHAGDQARQVMFDVKQVRTVTRFDGLNRAVYEERDDPDDADTPEPVPPRQTYEAHYDIWDRLVEETRFDWLETQILALTSTFEYDDWGEQRCVIGPDGVRTFEETDPIGTLESAGPVQTAWTDGGSQDSSSGVTVTWLNLFEKPAHVERLDGKQQRISLTETLYDGLGRSVQETVGFGELKRVTRFVYDPFDRLVETTLPDTAVVRRTYAEHTREDLPVSISVEYDAQTDILGEQAFDGLDRMTLSVTGGRERKLEYLPGQMQPHTVTTPSGQVIRYEYRPQLGEEPLHRYLPDSVTADYEYDAQNARLLNCQEQGESLTREYFSTGELKHEVRITPSGQFSMHYRYSRLGRLLGYTDVFGQEQTYRFDSAGRLEHTELGSTGTDFTYDDLGRTKTVETLDGATARSVNITLEYDDFGRETLRTFNLNGVEQTLAQSYDDVDKLLTRTLKQGPEVLRDETFEYDPRGRLINYECTGPQRPVDPYGKLIDSQVFTFDGMDNLTIVMTYFGDDFNRTRYFYDGDDPVQLSRLSHTHEDYPGTLELAYDLDGNLTSDEQGRTLRYDAVGRLLEVSGPAGGSYHYDPLDTLASHDDASGGAQEQRFYRDGELASQRVGVKKNTFMRGGDILLAQVMSDAASGGMLLAVNDSNTVLSEIEATATRTRFYTVFGHSSGLAAPESTLGFNGELTEATTGWQLLGNGYRAYNPLLMRFHSPDNLSPFGEGGLNAYGYCDGDSVNLTDPTGHSPWGALIRRFRAPLSSTANVPTGLLKNSKTSPVRLSKLTLDDLDNLGYKVQFQKDAVDQGGIELQTLQQQHRRALEGADKRISPKALNKLGDQISALREAQGTRITQFEETQQAAFYATGKVGKRIVTKESQRDFRVWAKKYHEQRARKAQLNKQIYDARIAAQVEDIRRSGAGARDRSVPTNRLGTDNQK